MSDNVKVENQCFRPLEPRDFMGEEFQKLDADKKFALIASALAGVMDHTKRISREVDDLNCHGHGQDGRLMIPIERRRYY